MYIDQDNVNAQKHYSLTIYPPSKHKFMIKSVSMTKHEEKLKSFLERKTPKYGVKGGYF